MSSDTVVVTGSREVAQVHCWGDQGLLYTTGSIAPRVDGHMSYSIRLSSGVCINVIDEIIRDVNATGLTLVEPIFDSFGRPYDEFSSLISEQIADLAQAS